MALGFLYTCACGKRFKVYIPKQRLFTGMTGKTIDWQLKDEKDEADGSIAELERMSKVTECMFVDGRDCEDLACPTCNRELHFLTHFSSILTQNEYTRSKYNSAVIQPTPSAKWMRFLGLTTITSLQ